ncbi:MAG: hypothetical protein KAW09_06520, partial [Thermoplasmata archaeon]|nr:hypothetical protein [Thermoplasmata archaeon]
PLDFDNDGVPDADEGGDVDSDNEIDYPYGPDEWLETTTPSWYPPEGILVRVLIGRYDLPVHTGLDVARVYIDSDDNDMTGYSTQKIGADHMLEILGIEGEVVFKTVKEFTIGAPQTQWSWSTVMAQDQVRSETAFSSLEASFDATGLGFGPSIAVAFETSDWRNRKDDASQVGGRSLTRGDFGEYDIEYSSDAYNAFFTENADRVKFTRNGKEIAWDLPDAVYITHDGTRSLYKEIDLMDARLTGAEVTYEGQDRSVDITYVLEEGALKENIVLHSRVTGPEGSHLSIPTQIQFSSDLIIYMEGDEVYGGTRTDGPITFHERDSAQFSINSPFAIDSAGLRQDCQYI